MRTTGGKIVTHYTNDKRIKGDEDLMPALGQFVQDRSVESFLEAQRAFQKACISWSMWRNHCSEVINAGLLTMDDIAYSNCLPWRTASKSSFGDTVSKNAAKLYAYPLIDELQPRIVVAMGKTAAKILALGGGDFPDLIVWNRSQAPMLAVREERAATAEKIGSILRQVAT